MEFDETDKQFLEIAFQLAEEALNCDEVPVGCVFVVDGVEAGRGRNRVNETGDPTRHAEMVAIREMEQKYETHELSEVLRKSILYVSLEPCIMCAAAMYELGIKKMVFCAENQRFGGVVSVGNAAKYKKENNIPILTGLWADRSISLLKAFYDKQNPLAPDEKRKIKKLK